MLLPRVELGEGLSPQMQVFKVYVLGSTSHSLFLPFITQFRALAAMAAMMQFLILLPRKYFTFSITRLRNIKKMYQFVL